MKIPFDIKYRPQIESGEYKVETRNGSPVRIICWDAKGCRPIIALIHSETDAEEEVTLQLCTNGKFSPDGAGTVYDLFVVTPEEELTEFENELATVIGFAIAQSVSSPNEKMVEFVKNWSERLLSLAREQFIKDGYVIEKKAFHDAVKKVDPEVMKEVSENVDYMNEALRTEYEKGRADVLKDLPRWKKVGLNTGQTTLVIGYTNDEDKLYRNGYVISLTDLEKLPKEDEE